MVVMTLSTIMYTRLGLSNTQLALYTSWLYLPWVIKPLWSPLVDAMRTKRWWILSMQLLVGASLAGVALTLPTAWWLQGSLAFFWLMAFSSATHDIAADGFYILALDRQQQALFVGVRNTFYRIGMVIGQGGLVMLAGYYSWTVVFLILGLLMLLLAFWHSYILPKVETSTHEQFRFMEQMHEFWLTLKVFLTKPHIITSLLFILLFRLPEGLLTKIVPLFLTRTVAEGGLEMSKVDVGFISGTLGVIGLLLGGIVGGWAVSKWGLKKCLWPLVLCITLPDIVYVYLSYAQTSNLWIIGSCLSVEQLGYGLGFSAYTLFLIHFSRGERSTAVFSICTAGQYLGGAMIPGMVSGLISENVGYQEFFLIVMALCLVTFAVTALVSKQIKNE